MNLSDALLNLYIIFSTFHNFVMSWLKCLQLVGRSEYLFIILKCVDDGV